MRQTIEMDYYQYKSEHNEKVVKALTDQNQAYAAELSQIRGGWVAMQESLRGKEALIAELKDELSGVKDEEIGRMKELESAISSYIRNASTNKHAART